MTRAMVSLMSFSSARAMTIGAIAMVFAPVMVRSCVGVACRGDRSASLRRKGTFVSIGAQLVTAASMRGFADVTNVLADTSRHRALLFDSIISAVLNSGSSRIGLLDLRIGSYRQLSSRDVPYGLGLFVADQASDHIFVADNRSTV